MKDFSRLYNLGIEDASILELQTAMEQGRFSSKELVVYYLSRIAKYDQDGPCIHSIIEINPDAIFIAEALDLERRRKGGRGYLHGIPVLIKDNIETGDKMRISAGALALAQNRSTTEAFLIRQLRQAGAVILGKTNMTEWANGMSSSMWAGYSARGGQVAHPYGDFFVGGSSTGSAAAVAMSFAGAAVGTETSASILSPAVQMAVVGIKPTVGLISRSGIIPFSYSQDTAGPLARTVADAAVLLGALAGRDEQDPATWRNDCEIQDYTAFLETKGLQGKRIGVFSDIPEDLKKSGEYHEERFRKAVSDLTDAGATVVDKISIPSFYGPWQWEKTGYEFSHGTENYLQSLPAHMPVHSLSELVEWNEQHGQDALKYGQDILESRQNDRNPLRHKDYIEGLISDGMQAQRNGMDYALDSCGLDAIMFPAYLGADLCARAGYPSIAVPAGYGADGRPFGITFAGKAFSEPVLIQIAYAYEQATKHRQKPDFR